MIKENLNIFDNYKIRNSIYKSALNTSILFQLNFDSKGAYVKVIDSKKKEPIDVEHINYDGIDRELLKIINEIKEKKSFNVSWDNSHNKVYLFENDLLIEKLCQSNKFVSDSFSPIDFVKSSYELKFIIKGVNVLNSKLALSNEDKEYLSNIVPLSSNYVYLYNKVYKVPNLGNKFDKIIDFETEFPQNRLQEYLSLLFSNIENVKVEYNHFKFDRGETLNAIPTLIFEKIDNENFMYVKVSTTVNNLPSDFLENYDIEKVALVNDLERVITVCNVKHIDTISSYEEIDKIFSKYKRQLESKNEYFLDNGVFVVEEELAKAFIFKELSLLIPKYKVFGTDKLKKYNVKTVKPKLKLSLTHDINFLEGDANLEIEGETLSLFEVLDKYDKGSYIKLSDGTNAIINKSYIEKLKRIFKKNEDKVSISFFDLPIVEELIDDKIAQDYFIRSKEIYMGFNNLEEQSYHVPPDINAELREYQKQGYKWLRYLNDYSFGGCLADDMGLGKTLQTISLLSNFYPEEEKSSLIIMPKSLLFNWENEIRKFNDELSYYIYYADTRDIEEAMKHNLILTTYAMARNEINKFREEKFFYVVLDESQNIKNVNSQISRAVMLLNSDYKLALSGTPIENNLSELYSLFRFLNPSMFGTLEEFNKFYAVPIQRENDSDSALELRKKIYPFVLRRLKKDVLKELPDKIEQTLFVDMSDEQKIFYEQRRAFYYESVKSQITNKGINKSQFFILQALSELRQIASIPESKSDNEVISPKREVLIENILEVIANDHKVLVFANFLNAIDLISQDLEKENIEHLVMTGATRNRKELVEKFQNDENCKVFLMTLKTGGIGLNLTAADYIFIFDPWWNKAAENQAIDRTHRIGQDKTVFSYKLITKGTIEEKILKLQERKVELFDSIISSDNTSIKSLDENDVEFILGS